jgi:hypothetical protein
MPTRYHTDLKYRSDFLWQNTKHNTKKCLANASAHFIFFIRADVAHRLPCPPYTLVQKSCGAFTQSRAIRQPNGGFGGNSNVKSSRP